MSKRKDEERRTAVCVVRDYRDGLIINDTCIYCTLLDTPQPVDVGLRPGLQPDTPSLLQLRYQPAETRDRRRTGYWLCPRPLRPVLFIYLCDCYIGVLSHAPNYPKRGCQGSSVCCSAKGEESQDWKQTSVQSLLALPTAQIQVRIVSPGR